MRCLAILGLVVVLGLGACSGGGHVPIDAADNGAIDAAVADGPRDAAIDGRRAVDAAVDGSVDAGRGMCLPTGACPLGPACGVRCCGQGEHCDNGVCRCGPRPGCGQGDHCAAPGPIGGDACGSICCGVSGPCPL